jgi:YggT family protein
MRRVMGSSGIVWTGRSYVDLAPLAVIFVLWLGQAVLVRLLGWIAAPPLWILRPGEDLGRWLAGIINLLFQIYAFLLLVRVLLEWIRVSYTKPLMRFLWDVTEPLLAPIRRRLPVFAGLDFSPIVAILLLAVAQALLVAAVQAIF